MAKVFIETFTLLDLGGENYHIDGVIVAASDSIEINKRELFAWLVEKKYNFASLKK